MKLSQAIDRFSTLSLDGWNGTKWLPGICKGALVPFDRFITERTFGQKKRLFMTNSHIGRLDQFSVVRAGQAGPYIIGAKNVDLQDYRTVYNNIYLLISAPEMCEILEITSGTSAAGTPMGKTLTVLDTVHCDRERFSNRGAADVEDISFSQVKITLPGGTTLHADNELRVNGVLYDIKDVDIQLTTVVAYCIKRSAEAS